MERIGGMSTAAIVVAAVALLGAGAFFSGSIPQLSTGGGGGGGNVPQDSACGPNGDIACEKIGDDSTFEVRTYDGTEDSKTQVGSTVYFRQSDSTTTVSASSGSSSAASNTYSVGDTVNYWAHGSTYTYGESKDEVLRKSQVKRELTVWEGASQGDISMTILEDEGSSDDDGSVDAVGANAKETIDGIELEITTDGKAFNPGLVAFKYSNVTDSNVSSISAATAESVSCPEHLSGYDDCFLDFNPGDEEPMMQEFNPTASESAYTIEADSDGLDTSNESLFVQVLDKAPFQTTEDTRGTGFEDDSASPSDVGVTEPITKITFE